MLSYLKGTHTYHLPPKVQPRHFKLVISESSTHFSPLVNKTAHMQVKKPNINKNLISESIAWKKQGKSVYIISS